MPVDLVEILLDNPHKEGDYAVAKYQQLQPLSKWNHTKTDYPKDLCIHQLFELQVTSTPDAVAVVFEEQQLTYQELNNQANQLAHLLRRLGVKPEVLVGICVERSLEMIVGLLGIFKAGGAYVPLDPSYPQKRLVFMVKDAEVPILITQQHLRNLLSNYESTVVYLDTDRPAIALESEANPVNWTIPENLAYCIYTSGSTGKPKGTLLEHRGLCNLAIAQSRTFNVQADSRVLQFASLNFDASISEIVMALISGATLCLATQDTLLPGAPLLQLLHKQAITTVTLPPSVLATLPYDKLTALHTIIVAGESCSADLVARWVDGRHFFNAYGPTETTVCATIAECTNVQQKPPIGHPIANTQIYILDNQMQPVSVGVAGELYISSVGLARGYLNRLDLTAERFVPNPFSKEPNARLYKTGDWARYQEDGHLEFLGRIDHQVKIRGFRIELGEIEEVLQRHPDISDAVVVVREDVPGDKRLVAYFVVYQLAPQRVPIRNTCLVECMVKVDEDDTSVVTTEDISYGGIGLSEMPGDCHQGQRVHLHLQLPDISEGLWLKGNIAWLQGNRAGIQFDPTPTEQTVLRKSVDYCLKKQGLLTVLQNSFIDNLRHFVEKSLPHYMVPSHFMVLEALPLTPNGKVDRQALPAPDMTRPDLRSPVEEKLLQIWADVLRLERVSLHENFLELGGHSLLATRIISRLNEDFKIDLPLYTLFQAPTVAKLAKRVEALLKSSYCRQTQLIEPVARDIDIPLSFAQQQLWLEAQLVPADMPVYNEPTTLHLGGPINIVALEQSLHKMIQRHEILRTTFTTTATGQPIQVISPTMTKWSLSVIDLRTFSNHERESECLRLATLDAQQPFDLTKGPLFRATLMQLEEDDYRLYLTLHHIIFDGVSLYNIFLPELATLYKAFSTGQPSPLPKPLLQYADYANWQRQWLQEDVLEQPLAYWKQQLADLPMLQLPTDRPRLATQSFRGARYCLALPKPLTDKLKTFSQNEGVTLFMTLLAAFKVLLYRYTGQEDIPVGTVTAGRNRAELEKIIGFFPNTLVLRTDLSDNPSFRQLLKQVREVILGAFNHDKLPFEQLIKALRPARHLSSNPLFQVAFILDPHQAPNLESGWTLSRDIHPGTTKFDLTMELEDRPQGIIGNIEYSTDLFDEATIIRLVGHYQTLLESIMAVRDLSISHLPLLTAKEQQQLQDWNKSPLEMCIHQLFETQVGRTPNAVAIVFEDQQLTYRELNERANQLAHYLINLGVKLDILVGICVERSVEMIVGMLAILKAGGAYVPLDPAYPQERLTFIIEDAQVRIFLTQQHLQQIFLGQGLLIPLDSDWEKIVQESKETPSNLATPNNLAYVIYTSGSTGKPKGVMLEHRGLCNLATAQIHRFDVQPDSRVLQFASLSFDASISEIVMTLVSGATLHVARREALLPGLPLLQLLREQAITTVTLPPSVLATLPVEDLPALRTIIVAGEQVDSAELMAHWVPGRRFFNAYGPTETTVCATIAECVDCRQKPSIGHPIANTQVYVLDTQLQPVPVGIPGELYIGGVGLARGYINRPELTAEKFIHNPFSDNSKTCLYKTGDLVRYQPDGDLEFLGRLDHQVKFHGFRIELGEIEAVLQQHSAILDVVIIVREDVPGDKRLVAYWVAKQQPTPSTTELRHFLTKKLPDYMIPSAFILLETLPLTPNGKVDRKALPKLEGLQRDLEASYIAPQTELEQTIAKIWQEVLRIEKVGIHDTFFELGGDSLLVVQVQNKLTAALKQPVPVTVLFQYPTIYELTRYLNQLSSHKPTASKPRSTRAGKQQQAINRQKQHRETRRKLGKPNE